ncbi:MAG TPA: hypothetical protein VGU61_09745 [Noviherbaspirillum sp.]|jgi:hypothetical protein|uniref:hypothetical protein n=1 Tax=Noviherbaspirillum sp. TaxID=1926288 RepID=UPI002DDDB0E7|nr:hypothetical protein [Noviherbaspirillum sp.]HEV2610538.1 hypothetical protein [Noviherbaspirillum sp.]
MPLLTETEFPVRHIRQSDMTSATEIGLAFMRPDHGAVKKYSSFACAAMVRAKALVARLAKDVIAAGATR